VIAEDKLNLGLSDRQRRQTVKIVGGLFGGLSLIPLIFGFWKMALLMLILAGVAGWGSWLLAGNLASVVQMNSQGVLVIRERRFIPWSQLRSLSDRTVTVPTPNTMIINHFLVLHFDGTYSEVQINRSFDNFPQVFPFLERIRPDVVASYRAELGLDKG